MQVDTSLKGMAKAFMYVVACLYTWIDAHGINAYVFTALFFLMALDIVLGVIKSKVVSTLPNPSSRKAKKGILTKLIMLVIPAVTGIVWGAFHAENALKIVNLLLTALMVAEGYSNIANAYAIYSGEELEEYDAVSFVFKKAGQKIKELLEALLK